MANSTGSVEKILLNYPPKPLVSDRIQLGLLIVMILIGGPVNLAAFTRLLKQRSLGRRNGRLCLLKIHLNITDLMVIFIYVTTTICWQITYEWRGGEILCKFVKFLSSTSFQASSNLIISVAFDRLLTVLNGRQWYKRRFKRRTVWYVRLCLIAAWLSAVILNLPQLYVWRLYSPYPSTRQNWRQCTTIYAIYSHKKRLALTQSNNTADDPIRSPVIGQFTYDLTHLILVFWIPALLIATSYTFVLLLLYRLESRRRQALTTRLEDGQDFEIDNGANFPLQQCLWKCQQKSIDSTAMGFNGTRDRILSVTSAGDQNGAAGGESRKESQSTTVSSHVYLVPVEISRVRNNTFRVSFMLVAAYLICWAPYNILALWQFIDEKSYKAHANSIKFLNALIVLNSVVNPFLYGAIKIKRPVYR